MPDVVVLGAGRVGAAIARDLAGREGLTVTVADASAAALDALASAAESEGVAIRRLPLDVTDPVALAVALRGRDLVVGAVPGPLGFRTARGVIEAGVDLVDISFFEEDPYELEELALDRGVTVVVDAGVAPGLSNLILGHHEARLREATRFECLVGGLPASPEGPWEYRAPFSPIDVLAEYTRPVRLRRGGRDEVRPALSDLETIELPGVGPVEAFNTDGLRTLLRTSSAADLVEKTVRWPGHAARIRLLRDSGFLDAAPLPFPGGEVSPLSMTSRLLFDAWRYRPGEEDLTVMRIVVEGHDDHGPVRHTYHLLDRYDRATSLSSMARTTGYTATALVGLVLDGTVRRPGISPPERVAAADGALEAVLSHLAERGVEVRHEEERFHASR